MIRRPPRSTRTDTHLPSRRSADLDLFGEDSYFADGELFWQMQNAAVAAKRDALLEVGWREVVVLERGRRFHEWEHGKTAKRKGGRVFVTVWPRGEIEFPERSEEPTLELHYLMSISYAVFCWKKKRRKDTTTY